MCEPNCGDVVDVAREHRVRDRAQEAGLGREQLPGACSRRGSVVSQPWGARRWCTETRAESVNAMLTILETTNAYKFLPYITLSFVEISGGVRELGGARAAAFHEALHGHAALAQERAHVGAEDLRVEHVPREGPARAHDFGEVTRKGGVLRI